MERILSIFLAMICCNTSAYADDTFNGFLIGLNGGVYFAQAHTLQDSLFVIPEKLIVRLNNGNSTNISDNTGTIGINFGYSQSISPCWVLGVEARGNYSDLHLKQSITVLADAQAKVIPLMNMSIKTRQQYSILAKIGFKPIPEMLLYGLVGPELGVFDLNYQGSLKFIENDITSSVLTDNPSFRQWGYLLGLGMEYLMYPNISMGLEYNFKNYGTLNNSQSANGIFFTNNTPLQLSTAQTHQNFTLRNNAILLRATYYYSI